MGGCFVYLVWFLVSKGDSENAYISTLYEGWPVGVVGYEGGGDGHVLDLDTAVKDGGFGWGCWSWCRLKKMIEELDLSKVPSVFIFPIRVLQMRMSVIFIFYFF